MTDFPQATMDEVMELVEAKINDTSLTPDQSVEGWLQLATRSAEWVQTLSREIVKRERGS